MSDEQEKSTPVKQIKLDSSRSRFAAKSIAQKNNQESLDEKAKQVSEELEDHKKKGLELSRQFLEILKDKTLFDNKGPIQKSLEKDVIAKLIDFAVTVNNDEYEQEGMGSVSLIALLLRSSLIMRDNYNQLEFKFEKMKEKIILLESLKNEEK